MKKYEVTGYQMVKNPNTWEMERTGKLMTINVMCAKNSVQMIEGEVSNKMNFDWFEAVTIC